MLEKTRLGHRSPKTLRILALVFAGLSVLLTLLINGLSDPLGYLVDIPSFALADMMDAYPEYYGYYFIALLAVTAAISASVEAIICGEEEVSPFSADGVLLWVVGIAVGILADSIARDILMEKWILPVLEHKNESLEAAKHLLILLIAVVTAWYFVMDDFTGNALSITMAPYAMQILEGVLPDSGILANHTVLFILLTAVLKLLLYILEKLHVDAIIGGFFKKYYGIYETFAGDLGLPVPK